MVEELFFRYDINSRQEADFKESGVELKCTPLLKCNSGNNYRIKERLVCTMIDYFDIVATDFDNSHLAEKCRLMLLLFYLHSGNTPIYDLEFIFRVLWELPEKDLIQIRQDYNTIAAKVKRGEAHLISEGDTMYLGACRKGQKGDNPQPQPYSETKAFRRAFSLKPAYMRFILSHVVNEKSKSYTNYTVKSQSGFELVNTDELRIKKFESIIIDRFKPFIGLNYLQICHKLATTPYQAKNKYADIAGLIASCNKSNKISRSEEFLKSGIIVKTVRLRHNGTPKEAMSFKNIDYTEIYRNDDWFESEAYEIFTSRFLFVVFKPVPGETITLADKTGQPVREEAYVLDKVFFWTMPQAELDTAREFWQHIRNVVIENRIEQKAFWKISDRRNFHVRPKARTKALSVTANPNGGTCEKLCYWMNAEYVKQIIDSQN